MIPYTSNELRLLQQLLVGVPGDTDYPLAGRGVVDVPKLRTKLTVHITREESREQQNEGKAK